jgi:putative membrane protein
MGGDLRLRAVHAGVMILHGAALDQLRWSSEPGVVVPLALTGALYARGATQLRRRGRGLALRRWELMSFVVGWLVVALSLLSPLHDASEQLFSAHMVQHELLMVLAAPLLVLGRPMMVMLWALPRSARQPAANVARQPIVRAVWGAITRPFDAWLIHGAAIWVWHLPSLFEATLHSDFIHALQHASFLGSALMFWWSIVHVQRRSARGMSVVYLFTTAVHTGVLGALMTFSRAVWYPAYANGAAQWNLTPMADQQLAGLFMWIPASVAYLVAALLVMRQWLHDSEWGAAERDSVLSTVMLH